MIVDYLYQAMTSPETSNFETSVITFDVSAKFGPEYVPMFEDIARLVTIQFIIQTMLFTMDNKSFPLFSVEFMMMLIFITVGVLFYWLVLKKLVAFK